MKYLFLVTALAGLAIAADGLPDKAAAILNKNCAGCHGGALKMASLDLRTRDGMLSGGERGPAIVPGKPEASRLYRFAAGLDQPSMPPGKSMPADQVEILRQWIAEGAEMKAGAIPKEEGNAALAKLEERPITAEERNWWAFRKPVRVTPPKPGNPIDAFLSAAYEAKGLKPSKPADKRGLLRRAYLDLIGIPPTPEQIDAFLKDTSPNAFANVVELLLASNAYGERWGRHWLDLVRYADSGGYEYDRDRVNGWRYRDYIIAAFNKDKPYNQFLREQIAGDELDHPTHETIIATGYLRQGPENNIKTEQTRMDEIDDIIVTTSNSFLGLTVGCARCHNHKFDPIPQKDYYRMQAVFFPAKAHEAPLVDKDAVEHHDAEMRRITRLQDPLKKQLSELEKPYRATLRARKIATLPEYFRAALDTPEEKRSEGQKLNAIQVEKSITIDAADLAALFSAADKVKHAELSKAIAALEKQRPAALPQAMTVVEAGAKAPDSYFLHRGNISQKGSKVSPGVLSVATEGEWKFPAPPEGAHTAYRRRGFADWLTSPDNPLTPRVAVNRIWMHHFGEGIVRTPSNFGRTGEKPTHPELLDWLATEFVAKGWSMKAMHRLIMNSRAYQQASEDIEANVKLDPDNRMLWRMPRRRVEAEAIRDSILAVSGTLNTKAGGPGVFPYIDPALFQSSSKRTWPGRPDTDTDTWRRSVYVFSKRSIPLPMLDIFDKPDSVAACGRRNRSTIAPQALILMNNSFVRLQARMFAERLQKDAAHDAAAQVRRAFELALSRKPSQSEEERALSFIRNDSLGLVDLCQALFNLNEFVYMP